MFKLNLYPDTPLKLELCAANTSVNVRALLTLAHCRSFLIFLPLLCCFKRIGVITIRHLTECRFSNFVPLNILTNLAENWIIPKTREYCCD